MFCDALKNDQKIIHDFINLAHLQTHPLISDFLSNASGLKIDGILRDINDLYNCTISRCMNATDKSIKQINVIPKIFHRVWITDLNNPRMPPEDFINSFVSNSKLVLNDWDHVFWVLCKTSQSELCDRLNKEGIFKVREISELHSKELLVIALKLIEDKKFPFATDVIRMLCLDEFGGVYSDLGICFNYNPSTLTDSSEYLFLFCRNLFFQNSLMGMHPGSVVTTVYKQILNNPKMFPRFVKLSELSGLSEGYLFAGPFITWIIFTFLSRKSEISIVAPNGEVISWMAQQSWYSKIEGEGKLGNCYIPDSRPSIFVNV